MSATEQKNNALKDLLSLALAGDQRSYQNFLSQISQIIRIVVAKKITSADVEDVVQEVLISIHKARHTYDLNRPLMPWLMAIANFRITDYLRKHYAKMRHKTSDIEEFVDILADVTNEPVGNELVDEMLALIDLKQRKILTMLYIEGHTAREVGRAIGMNESAVKVAAHRAVKKIKQKFSR
jgi:RNA polymerase sigma-70 factor (ECF subfamily)